MPVETPRLEVIDQLVRPLFAPGKPGAALTVLRAGQTIHCAGYGLANMEWERPVTPDTVFGLGSTTKPFTATAIMLLESDGLLNLVAPITDYLPGYDCHGAAITLTHLLTHTSGIPNLITRPGFWESIAPLDHTLAQVRARFEELPLDFAPGERYSYSNSGYYLLGMVITRLSGMTYQEFIRTRIFAPLGMTSSGYLDGSTIIPRLAAPYMPHPNGSVTYPAHVSPAFTYSSGALCSTVEDMARWDASLRTGSLLDHATLARMWRPLTLNNGRHEGYGLGWGLSTYRGHAVVHHGGGVPGYSAFFARFVEDDLTIIILSNRGLFDSASLLAAPIANLLLDLPEPTYPVVTVDPAGVAGVYSNLIGDVIEFSFADGALHAAGELTADLIATGPGHYYAAGDPDVSVQFEDPGPHGYNRATVTVPFYWYTVYRRPDDPSQPNSASALSSAS